LVDKASILVKVELAGLTCARSEPGICTRIVVKRIGNTPIEPKLATKSSEFGTVGGRRAGLQLENALCSLSLGVTIEPSPLHCPEFP
jgi:hypothetical protein